MYLKSELGTVYYEVHGKANAPTIIFSHGVSMDHHTFDAQVEALKESYQVIVWDFPFHGKSSPIDTSLSFSKTSVKLMIEILDELQINKAVWAGLSLGSFVTQRAASMYPNRVSATVHIGGGSIYPSVTGLLKALKPLVSLYIGLYPPKAMYKAFAEHRALAPETKRYMEEVASKTGKAVVTHLTKEMLNDMVEGLPSPLAQPMLITYGDQEMNFIKKNCIKWHESSSNSQLAVIQNARHIANQDNPDDFNAVLLAFLKTV
ncbi:alpha/beta fold hydrolase [Desulfuribacillus alkaliarsenatis]|uniref:AB hydrolase-1 domain-containing protein n=1 Tax=Desulfuribacillus alkaliarsenatis TaxID=766136 RepID=A0A1E5G2E8_9FIRM|nr:alpha/beta hydrolase [Desulfuribacillus alkaliarsenatis]OEF97160.1 hypothetical protein BHF68_06070 [Desulfuribacillus alkaliarsenatis]